MSFTDMQQYWAMFEIAAATSVMAMLIIRRAPQWAGLVLFVLLLLPIGSLSLAGYIRGFTGDLSIVSFLLLLSIYFFPPQTGMPKWLTWGTVLFGVIFYACALGVGMTDPYAWGYDSWQLLVALLGLGVCFWLARFERVTLILGLAILAWIVGLHESSNLWDYVMDPYLLMGIVFIHCRGVKGAKKFIPAKAGTPLQFTKNNN